VNTILRMQPGVHPPIPGEVKPIDAVNGALGYGFWNQIGTAPPVGGAVLVFLVEMVEGRSPRPSTAVFTAEIG